MLERSAELMVDIEKQVRKGIRDYEDYRYDYRGDFMDADFDENLDKMPVFEVDTYRYVSEGTDSTGMPRLVSVLDRIADSLDEKGCFKEAYELDRASGTIDKYPSIFGLNDFQRMVLK